MTPSRPDPGAASNAVGATDSAPADRSGDEHLACGASTDELLDQVADGRADQRDAHQAGCRHCRATLAEYERLWTPIADLAAAPVSAPEGLLDNVLADLRAATGPVGYGQVTDDGGRFLVAARAVVAVAGHAARTTSGVRIALSSLSQRLSAALPATVRDLAADHDGVEAGLSGRTVALEVTVAAEYGQDLHALADRLRARVAAEVRAVTGLDATDIAVTIDDVFSPRPEG